MNPPPSEVNRRDESARRTYLSGALFLTPAFLAWLFSYVLILPALKEIWGVVGAHGSRLQWLIDSSNFFMFNGRLVIAVALLAFIGLEYFLPAWPKYRRTIVAAIVFMLNAAVLIGMAVLCTSAMVAAKLLLKPS